MALNINTNIKNNLDGYLLDAKNVKGGYIVVADYSEISNLPSACIVNGTLVYCQSDYSTYGAGFYQYNGLSWQRVELINEATVVAIPTNVSSIDVGVTITISSENKTKILGSYGKQCILDININGNHHLFYKSNDISQTQMDFICVSNEYIIVAKFNGTDNTSQLSIQSKKEYEYQAHKKTSVSTYSSSDTYFPTTKAVYDFVKSETKYVIVSDYTALPSSNLTEGMLAYCQASYHDIDLDRDYEKGFYQIVNNAWKFIYLENPQPVEITITGNFDITQDYTFDLSYENLFKLLESSMLVIKFSGGGQAGFNVNFLQPSQNAITSSAVFVLNDTQYISTLDIDLNSQTNNATLSFSEIEGGGSGGGGTTTTKKWYEFRINDEISSPVSIANITADIASMQVKISEEQWQEFYTDVLSNIPAFSSISTPQDFVDFYNNNISGVGGGGTALALLAPDLVDYAMENQSKCQLVLSYSDGDGDGIKLYPTSNIKGFGGTLSTTYGGTVYNWFDYITGSANSSMSLVETEETISGGGSSTGGGSGKLYELDFNMVRYDQNGNIVGDTSANNNQKRYFKVYIYESNFERLKVLEQQAGISNINTIQDLVSYINSLDETTASVYALGNNVELFLFLLSQVDICFIDTDYENANHTFRWNYSDKVLNIDGNNTIYTNNPISAETYRYIEEDINTGIIYTYGLNTNNSCTLTEYGTSGGGGGTSATRTKYHIEVEDSNNHKAIVPIYQDTFEDYLVEFNQVGQAMATSMGETWTTLNNIAEFKTLFDTQKATQYAFGCDLGMNLLVKYAYDSGENPLLVFANNTREQAKVVNEMLNYDLSSLQTPLAYPLGAITSISYDPETIVVPNTTVGSTQLYYWFKPSVGGNSSIEIDSDATFTYTEEQVAGGSGSGSSQPTIPERFSLAYNLVVNINQEQFANGSWTGSNSDNIRTFQYNGSNADETKAKELVEFLTGVNVLDSYNATKPTPCFVFCTQSNICWKLQWDNSLLHAYKVENFPFVVKENVYRWTLSNNDNDLRFWISETVMQDLITQINQIMPNIDPNWQNITEFGGIINLFNTLKQNASDPTTFGLILAMLGCGGYVFGDRTVYSQKTPIYFTKFSSNSIDTEEVKGIKASRSGGVITILYKDPFGILSNGLITNDSSEASDGIYIDSNANLHITKI